jgi:hypothetical protein
MDQRKVNMLAREYCDDIKRKLKPIILSHRMMPGLLEVRNHCGPYICRCYHVVYAKVGGVEPKGRCALGHTRPL